MGIKIKMLRLNMTKVSNFQRKYSKCKSVNKNTIFIHQPYQGYSDGYTIVIANFKRK